MGFSKMQDGVVTVMGRAMVQCRCPFCPRSICFDGTFTLHQRPACPEWCSLMDSVGAVQLCACPRPGRDLRSLN